MTNNSNAIAIKAENLVKSFGTLRAVDGLSLSINKGEVFGFLGPNGAGKTTSIKMLCGLLKPDSGRIQIESNRSNPSIGVCPQNIVVWENLTCIEQLVFIGEMYGLSHKKARIKGMELLEILGLTSKLKSCAKTLSGGMQRRLNIALALIHDPEILILDEPQAGLGLLTVGCFPVFVLMFFSDCMIPLPKMKVLSIFGNPVYMNDVLPTAIATGAFNKILNYNANFADISFEFAAILLLSILYFAIGVLLFKKKHISI